MFQFISKISLAFLFFIFSLESSTFGQDGKPFLSGTPQALKEFSQFSNSIKELIYAEQYLIDLDRDPKYRIVSTQVVEGEYSPNNHQIFSINGYWLPAAKFDTFDLDIQNSFEYKREKKGRDEILFLVHPQSETTFADLTRDATEKIEFHAVATASSRTLLIWPPGHPESAVFAKLSLDATVAGSSRLIPATEIARSLGIEASLKALRKSLPTTFKNLDESLGIMPKGRKRGGMIIREIPPDLINGRTRMTPFFSIYSNGPQGHTPLLAQWIKDSGLSAEDYVRTKIIRPFVNQWVEAAANFGIVVEAHGQNVLMELDNEGKPTGKFIYRDLGGFNLDFNFMKIMNFNVPSNLPVYDSFEQTYFLSKHSKATNHSMASYFIGGIAQPLGQRLEDWYARGILPREKFGAEAVEEATRVELSNVISSRLGSKATFRHDLDLTGLEVDIRKIQYNVLKNHGALDFCSTLLSLLKF